MKIGFVILHYLTEKDTIECVRTIQEIPDSAQKSIVIIDNNSNNGSIEKIEQTLGSEKNIFIIKNKKNLGFARGNNVGYSYCKEKLKCDCIIICNNDTLFTKSQLLNTINEDIEKHKCGIIAPDIKSLIDNGHQNPMSDHIPTIHEIKKTILKYRVLLLLYKLHLKSPHTKQNETINNGEHIKSIKLNIIPHGACIIFTPIFTSKMNSAFNDKTFLYLEEILLKIKCDKANITTLYDPRITVLHKEDSSTNKLNNNNSRKKKIFILKNLIKSHIVLLREERES